MTDEAALRRVADQIGPVDVLVNSAGIIGSNKPLVQTTAESGGGSSTSTSSAS